ncbi:hypothetical protein BWQ96_07260 [Gracilariopsis chorda]|uniref:Uncharacterized protein n=1 Tax=Gracilariopsis chorda TaxID=448386 RepID=A0A2V3ILP3_9FLOR|nr:hypothetical protein BWQ96_07260 [Gracilariopsis chorda]|eukprot:PXF43012.1 hypothetical protein BWQ96_07260 [Gracilariopsis chorda]
MMVSKDVDVNENVIGWNQQHIDTAEEVDLAEFQHEEVAEDSQVKMINWPHDM